MLILWCAIRIVEVVLVSWARFASSLATHGVLPVLIHRAAHLLQIDQLIALADTVSLLLYIFIHHFANSDVSVSKATEVVDHIADDGQRFICLVPLHCP